MLAYPGSQVRCVAMRLVLAVLVVTLCACASPGLQELPAAVPDGSGEPRKNVTIALLGATGLAGGFILEQALAQG